MPTSVDRIVRPTGGDAPTDNGATLRTTAGVTGPDTGGALPYHAGATVGRYTLGRRLGVGGMGVVFQAHDPKLDRTVAVKLLLGGARGSSDDERSGGQRRLLREAQAMAQLSHPNVVTVHDVGVHEDRVFVAMELIDGQTLTQWRRNNPPVEEVVSVFIAAATGLQAAHDVGLVHRDFKPDNVMLTAAGEVRVMDFGLARSTRTQPVVDPQESVTAAMQLAPADQTQTRGVAGTPAYMAPEQHSGSDITAWTDQFSFCVALYEVLYGQRPFDGDTVAALAFEVLEGNVRDAPRQTVHDVPAWLRRVVVRGLSVEPTQRWPSMAHLIGALRRDGRSRKRTIAVVTALGAITVAGWAAVPPSKAAAVCGGSQDRVGQTWNQDSRAALRRGLHAHGGPWASDMVAATEAALDDYAQQWVVARESMCAQASRDELPDDILDLGMACLQRRRAAMGALLDSLGQADVSLAEGASAAVARLRPVQSCHDPSHLLAAVAPPQDPERAAQVQALRADIAGLEAVLSAGQPGQVIEAARALEARVDATQYEPLVAEHRAVLGRALADAGEYADALEVLQDAFLRASALKHDRVAAEVGVALLRAVGVGQGDFEAAATWRRQTRAAVARVGDQTPVAARFFIAKAAVERTQGNFEPALQALAQALTIQRARFAEDSVAVLDVRQNIGAMRIAQGNYDQAVEALEPILVLTEKHFGPSHPKVARIGINLGAAEIKRGRFDAAARHLSRAVVVLQPLGLPDEEARALLNLSIVYRRKGDLDAAADAARRALAAMERAHGDQHVRFASALSNLATVESMRGDEEVALSLHQRSLAIRERAIGASHPDLAYPLAGIGGAFLTLGRPEQAEPVYRRALEVLSALPEDHPRIGLACTNLGGVLLELDRVTEARGLLERALAIATTRQGPEHRRVANVSTMLAKVLVRADEPDAARVAAERAVAIHQRGPERPRLFDAQFALALALWARDTDGDRVRAQALASEAMAGFEALGPGLKRPAAEIAAWLDERPAP